MERISWSRGSPFMAASIGYVMNCSISTGPRAGALVRTWTCTFVMSGTASIGSWVRA